MGKQESRVEQELIRGVKALGGTTFKFISPGRAGVPDRIVILPGGIVQFVELKAPGGTVSRIQKQMIVRLNSLDVAALVLTGTDEVRKYLSALKELMNR